MNSIQHILRFYQTISWHTSIVLCIYVGSLVVRLPFIHQPPLDAHPMRQTDTACVIHFLREQHLNFLYPQTCLIRPETNVDAYFFLELPIYQLMVALFQTALGSESWWSVRVINLMLFSCAYYCFYQAFCKLTTKNHALFFVFLFSFAPSSLFFFGQAIHPDVFMIATLSLSLLAVVSVASSEQPLMRISLAGVVLGLSIATRPYVALSILPLVFLLCEQLPKQLGKTKVAALCFLFISTALLPYGSWWLLQQQFAAADHSWQRWVLQGREQLLQWDILVNHLILKNVVGEVVGKAISVLAAIGLLVLIYFKKQRYWWVLTWLALIPVYWLIVPAGNINHQYYTHVVLTPILFAASATLAQLWQLTESRKPVVWLSAMSLLCLVLLAVVANGWRTSRYFFIQRVSPQEQALAREIASMVSSDEHVIYAGTSSLPHSLAYRKGWTMEQPPADVAPTAQAVRAVRSQLNPQTQIILVVPTNSALPHAELELLMPYLTQENKTENATYYVLK